MLNFGQDLTLLIFSGLSLIVLTAMMIYSQKLTNQNHRRETELLKLMLIQNRLTTQNLMDRLMSGDVKTYNLMSQVTKTQEISVLTSDKYSAMSDNEEIAGMVARHGLGEPIYDEEYNDFVASINSPRD